MEKDIDEYLLDEFLTFTNEHHILRVPKLMGFAACVAVGAWYGDGVVTISALVGVIVGRFGGTVLEYVLDARSEREAKGKGSARGVPTFGMVNT